MAASLGLASPMPTHRLTFGLGREALALFFGLS